MLSDDVVYLSFDPGETTGWAGFDAEGNFKCFGQIKADDLVPWLKENITDRIKLIIIEDYKIMGHKAMAHSWKRVPTIKYIGKIEAFAQVAGVQTVLQSNTNKTIGYMWLGIEPPSNHAISHQYDAAAHGTFYLQKVGIRKPSLPSKE